MPPEESECFAGICNVLTFFPTPGDRFAPMLEGDLASNSLVGGVSA
uniref:Uncharacterized protein n=1 Tax=Arundo donax TaxID=35708 RepID=A0A0A8ZHB8_ARUDO